MSDIQYFYTEKSVKKIAEAIRSITNTDRKFKISEMGDALTNAHPLVLGKPEDLFATQFNAQLGSASQCFRWGIFSKYPDDSYIVTLDGIQSSSNANVIQRGMLFNEDFTEFVPYYRFTIVNNPGGQFTYFTRQEECSACGVYLDSDGMPHIEKDLPFMMPTRNYSGYNGNQGRYFPSWPNTGLYNESASIGAYLSAGDIRTNPIFKNRFRAFGASSLNGKIPPELYSVLSDGEWHTGSEISLGLNISDFIDASNAPNTIKHAHFWNRLSYDSNDNLKFQGFQWYGGHCGPAVMYMTDDNDRWIFNTTNMRFYSVNSSSYGELSGYPNLHAYFKLWGDIGQDTNPIVENGHGVYPFSDGINKLVVPFTDYTNCSVPYTASNGYHDPRSVDDLESYIPFRTYDIEDQNGNILLPANATLADFGIS